jgi:hypothetical protein
MFIICFDGFRSNLVFAVRSDAEAYLEANKAALYRRADYSVTIVFFKKVYKNWVY